MPKRKRKQHKRYSDEQRSQILAAAKKEGLTAAAVEKRFGVKPITYYSWRKKTGAGRKRAGRRAVGKGGKGVLGPAVRGAVQARIRAILPGLVEAEVNRYLDSLFGAGGRRRG